jgi:hypothetical protein
MLNVKIQITNEIPKTNFDGLGRHQNNKECHAELVSASKQIKSVKP